MSNMYKIAECYNLISMKPLTCLLPLLYKISKKTLSFELNSTRDFPEGKQHKIKII